MDLEPIKNYPILKLAEALGIKVRGSQAMCFNGHDSKTPSLHFDTKKNTWKCYGACGSYGDNIDLVRELQGLDFKSAVAWFGGLGVDVTKSWGRGQYSSRSPTKRPHSKGPSKDKLHAEIQADPEVYNHFLELCDPVSSRWAVEYANQHGIPVEMLKKKGVCELNNPASLYKQLINKWGKARLAKAGMISSNKTRLVWPPKTLLFPFKNGLNTEYVQGRSLKGNAKFINLVGIKKPIYNEQVLKRVKKSDLVHICEGVPDAIAMESFGFYAVAILGASAFHEGYVDVFLECRVRVVSDGDAAGEKFWDSINKVFKKRGFRVDRLKLPENMDVGDIAARERNRE